MKKMNFDLNNLKVDNFKSVDTNETELNAPTRYAICDRTYEPEFCTDHRICFLTRPPRCPRTTPATGCPTPTTPAAGCTTPTSYAAGCTRPPACPRPTRFMICESRIRMCP